MFSAALPWILTAAGLLCCAVFVAAFRFALREAAEQQREHSFHPEVPRAVIQRGGHVGARWCEGLRRQHLIEGWAMLQATFVALGITAVFVMFLCMAGVVGVMLVHN